MRNFLMLGVLVGLTAPGEVLLAQGAWPQGGGSFSRGPGFYLSEVKLALCWLVILVWIRTSAWVNRDARDIGASVGLTHTIWNPIVVFSFLIALLLAFTIPVFAVGYLLLLVGYLAPLGSYIGIRNSRVTDDQKVLTPAHLKSVLLSFGRGGKPVEVKAPHEMGPPVDLQARGAADPQQNQANLIASRQSPGYITTKELLADAIDKRAERILLDYSAAGVAVRYEIDGIWHNLEPRERESSDIMLAVMKKLAALDINERRMRQQGSLGAKYNGTSYECVLTSQGTKTGERVLLHIRPEKFPFKTLEELGMRDKMREQFLNFVSGGHQGIVLISAPQAGGLTTTWTVSLKSADRLLRDFMSIEEKSKPTPYVENVDIVKFDESAGETPDQILPKQLLRQPDVLVLPELYNAETVRILSEQALNEQKLVIAGVRAKEAVEALLRVLLLKAPPQPFAQAVQAVLNQRLARRLCDNCKQPYEPPPQLLQKLGIPPGRVPVLYREWQPVPGQERPRKKGEPEVCPVCNGIGFRGRVAIFELLVVNDKLRAALVQQPKLEVLRRVARESGHKSLQEEGLLHVVKGVTSLTELQRVLKQ